MKSLLIALIFSFSAFSNPIFVNVKPSGKQTPYLLTLMLNHLQVEQISTDNAKVILKNLKEMNTNLSGVKPLNQKFFLSSEVYKSILNFRFKTKVSSDILSSIQIKKIEKKLNQFKIIYSPFSQFIIQSVYQDFVEFLEGNYIDRYQTLSNVEGITYLKSQKLKKVIKYSGRWANMILDLAPERFNKIATELIINFSENAKIQSKVFELHSPIMNTKQPPLTGLDLVEVTAFLNTRDIIPEKEAISPKMDAIKAIDGLNVDPLEKATQDIDELFKNNKL